MDNARDATQVFGGYGFINEFRVARHYRDEVVPLRKVISEENQLRYNGMLIGVFELLADARSQIASVNGAIDEPSALMWWTTTASTCSSPRAPWPPPGSPASPLRWTRSSSDPSTARPETRRPPRPDGRRPPTRHQLHPSHAVPPAGSVPVPPQGEHHGQQRNRHDRDQGLRRCARRGAPPGAPHEPRVGRDGVAVLLERVVPAAARTPSARGVAPRTG